MSLSLIAVFIWLIVANLAAMLPSTDNLWRRAYILIAIGVPLLGWVTYENGPWIGLVCMAAGASMLRWPLRYLVRYLAVWMKRKAVGGPAK